MKVGDYYVEMYVDTAFEAYELNRNDMSKEEAEEKWENCSSCACMYCRVYDDELYFNEIDDFVIHQDEVVDYLGLGDNDDILDVDMDEVFDKMVNDGYIKQFMNESDYPKPAQTFNKSDVDMPKDSKIQSKGETK